MTDAFICDAIRTPIGRYGGALAPVRPDDMAALVIAAIIARNPTVDWRAVENASTDPGRRQPPSIRP